MAPFVIYRKYVTQMVAAHLRTFLKECGSFAHTIFLGKRIHLCTQFPQVNVTFAHIRFSQVSVVCFRSQDCKAPFTHS